MSDLTLLFPPPRAKSLLSHKLQRGSNSSFTMEAGLSSSFAMEAGAKAAGPTNDAVDASAEVHEAAVPTNDAVTGEVAVGLLRGCW